MTAKVSLDCNSIKGCYSFHEKFARVFGFPAFYGRNMNAWIDCLTSLDAPEDGMSTVYCEHGSVVTLALLNVNAFAKRCLGQYNSMIECSAFVNWRRLELGNPSVLALSFHLGSEWSARTFRIPVYRERVTPMVPSQRAFSVKGSREFRRVREPY